MIRGVGAGRSRLWLNGSGPATVPAAHLCGSGSNGSRRGGGGFGRPLEPAVVAYGRARLPSIVYVPAVVCGGLVCGTAMVVGARTVTANDSTEGPPRATTRLFRWVYDAPTAHSMAACTLPTGGRAVVEASKLAAATVAGGAADGTVDGSSSGDRVTRVASAFGRPAGVGGDVVQRPRAVWLGIGRGYGGSVADACALTEEDPNRVFGCALHALAGTVSGWEGEAPGVAREVAPARAPAVTEAAAAAAAVRRRHLIPTCRRGAA